MRNYFSIPDTKKYLISKQNLRIIKVSKRLFQEINYKVHNVCFFKFKILGNIPAPKNISPFEAFFPTRIGNLRR